jgi:hypothetical protein
MPTTRIRHMITETDAVARAIDEAARRWPQERGGRAKLLLLLVDEGYRCIRQERDRETQRRRVAIERTSGSLTGMYEPDYLERLRSEWAE